MNPKQLQLALDKQRLQMQSTTQRAALAVAGAGVAPLFAAADTVRDGFRWLVRNPVWVVGGVAVLVVAQPRRMARWVRRGIVAWQAWRRVQQWRLEHLEN